jgi:hypothetical protein
MRDVYLRLVPLRCGGIPLNENWREPSVPSSPRETNRKPETKTKTETKTEKNDEYFWPTDLQIEIDETKTGKQVLRTIIEQQPEFQHLRDLDDELLQKFVSFYDMDDGVTCSHGPRSLLYTYRDSDPIELAREQVKWGRYGDPTIRFPKLLVILYPVKLEPYLLQTCLYSKESVRPIIWLDVDGVVNICGNDVSLTDTKTLNQCYGNCIVDWGVRYSPQIVAELNRLSKTCDIYWMTSWGHSARYQLAPAIGLDDFAVWECGKGNCEQWENFDRPLIWIDDDLDEKAFDPSIREERIENVKRKFSKLLLVSACLEKGHGLAQRHINDIDQFIASL